jgi:hypothetical protein
MVPAAEAAEQVRWIGAVATEVLERIRPQSPQRG